MVAVFFIICAIATIWSAAKFKAVYNKLVGSFPPGQDELSLLYALPGYALLPSTSLPLQVDYMKSLWGAGVCLLSASLGFFFSGNMTFSGLFLAAFAWVALRAVASWRTYKANYNSFKWGERSADIAPQALAHGRTLKVRSLVRAIFWLAIVGVTLDFGLRAYVSYRYGNIEDITINKMSDFESVFEIRGSRLKLKNSEFVIVCFVGDYSYSLSAVSNWISPEQRSEFATSLRAAGSLGDAYNDENYSSMVLLSPASALILQFGLESKLDVENHGCASADAEIEIAQSEPYTKFSLPNASLRWSRGR